MPVQRRTTVAWTLAAVLRSMNASGAMLTWRTVRLVALPMRSAASPKPIARAPVSW